MEVDVMSHDHSNINRGKRLRIGRNLELESRILQISCHFFATEFMRMDIPQVNYTDIN